ncbi:polysaccharide pyruvyl transferase family protein [candidate division WOR-3 bacterium]|nr:polysaccharide pyruvyl transferase family protein [candidate division WOR-3 bacterium]
MRIHTPEVRREQDVVKITAQVEQAGSSRYLWYSVPQEYEQYLTTNRLDAFVVGLLVTAMKNNEDMYVDGAMSEKLFYNITSYYMRVLEVVNPSLRRVRIIPEELDSSANKRGAGVATGFSGGVDSFCVLADHLSDAVPAGYRVTHLLFHNVGSHGRGGRRLFEERFAGILPAARELGLPLLKVDSNLEEFFSDPTLGYMLTHVPRGVSAALTLQGLIGRYFYASGYRYQDCRIAESDSLAFADPVAVPLLSTEVTECIPTGSQYSRVEKTERISDMPITHRYLDVCVDSLAAGNCSKCWKCNRTMLTLEILGKLDKYRKVFDLNIYRRNRTRFMGEVLSGHDPFFKEMIDRANELGWHFPDTARLWRTRHWLAGIPTRAIPSSLRGFTRAADYYLKRAWRLVLSKDFVPSLKVALTGRYVITYWWYDERKGRNFGDALNPLLISALSGRKVVHARSVKNLARRPVHYVIGSVLSHINTPHAVVWGSGFIDSGASLNTRPRRVLAVRGPLTRAKLLEFGVECPEVYGDPALLCPLLFRPSLVRRYSLGIVPHYIDRSSPLLERFRRMAGVTVIDVADAPEDVIRKITECEVIASSSLHGLIVADAYGIPSIWTRSWGKLHGDDFKFHDYFMSVGRNDEAPIVLAQGTTADDILSACRKYSIKIDLDRLLKTCPFPAGRRLAAGRRRTMAREAESAKEGSPLDGVLHAG